jgi:hypothetical protein
VYDAAPEHMSQELQEMLPGSELRPGLHGSHHELEELAV